MAVYREEKELESGVFAAYLAEEAVA